MPDAPTPSERPPEFERPRDPEPPRGIDRPRDPERRRAWIASTLASAGGPLPGDVLAERLGVSRQAIVQDIAVLRASGEPIVATVRGYVLEPRRDAPVHRAVVAVRHRPHEAEDELLTMVDLGVRVLDVVVEHPIYGELRADLHLASPADVRGWSRVTRGSGARLLSELTDGVHLHTIEADSAAALEEARAALERRGYLVTDNGTRAAAETGQAAQGSRAPEVAVVQPAAASMPAAAHGASAQEGPQPLDEAEAHQRAGTHMVSG
jgi:transcriptional regulator of NAD metabolism